MKAQIVVLVVTLTLIAAVLVFGKIAALWFTWGLFVVVVVAGVHDAYVSAIDSFEK